MGYLKSFKDLGMNPVSDIHILPAGYKYVEQPFYIGDGNHSVHELQELCKQFTEYCHQQAIIKQELIKEIQSL